MLFAPGRFTIGIFGADFEAVVPITESGTITGAALSPARPGDRIPVFPKMGETDLT